MTQYLDRQPVIEGKMLTKLMKAFYRLGAEIPETASLRFFEGGFIATKESGVAISVKFESINKITAFKRDLGTTDLVCFEISTSLPGMEQYVVEINEEMTGFEDLVLKLERYPNFLSSWRDQVMQPPFARQETVIFSRTV